MNKEYQEVVEIHFVGGNKLKLYGAHVPGFINAYKQAVKNNAGHFHSEAMDSAMIHMKHVTFVHKYKELIKGENDNE